MFCQHPSSGDGAIVKYELKPLEEVRGERLRSIDIKPSCPVAVVWRPLPEAAPFVGSPTIRNLGDVPGELALTFYVCLGPGEQAAAALQASQSAQRLASTDSSFVTLSHALGILLYTNCCLKMRAYDSALSNSRPSCKPLLAPVVLTIVCSLPSTYSVALYTRG
jgi:hypothetical protein